MQSAVKAFTISFDHTGLFDDSAINCILEEWRTDTEKISLTRKDTLLNHLLCLRSSIRSFAKMKSSTLIEDLPDQFLPFVNAFEEVAPETLADAQIQRSLAWNGDRLFLHYDWVAGEVGRPCLRTLSISSSRVCGVAWVVGNTSVFSNTPHRNQNRASYRNRRPNSRSGDDSTIFPKDSRRVLATSWLPKGR